MDKSTKERMINAMKQMSSEGLRCLAICYKTDLGELSDYTGKDHPAHNLLVDSKNYLGIETKPILCGIVGILDPARPEVAQAIRGCKNAGIFVIMITGDIKETAQAIAKQIGIIGKNDDISRRSFTGKEFFDKLSKEE